MAARLMDLNLPSWLEALLPASLVAGSGLIGYGKLQARVGALERQDQRTLEDHDTLTRLGAQHEGMIADLSEIKDDVKALLTRL
jgi:hypothetical protein